MKISIKNLHMAFANKPILKDITADFESGHFTGIIGPNGSGKSTLLKCIYRILAPDKGAIFLDGKELKTYSLKQTAQKQAVLAQHNYSNFDFEVLDVVLMGRIPYKSIMERDNAEDYSIARNSLKIVGMQDFEHRNFSLLSGGEQQRVMLARALTQKTQCLILDEPTNHLDIKYQLQLLNIVKQHGITVVAALHDLNLAAKYCDKILAIQNGKLVKYGTPREVLTSAFIYQMFDVETDVIKYADGRLVIVYK